MRAKGKLEMCDMECNGTNMYTEPLMASTEKLNYFMYVTFEALLPFDFNAS
jgi:hypothetical protein